MTVVQISSVQFGWLRGAYLWKESMMERSFFKPLQAQDMEYQVWHQHVYCRNENLNVPFNQHISESAI